MKKAIIAVYGKTDSGKSNSIKQYALRTGGFVDMNGNSVTIDPQNNTDIFGTIQLPNALVGITSQGDPQTGLAQRLQQLVNRNCDIIICATRTKRQTVWDVEHVERTHGYHLIWFGNFMAGNTLNQNRLNEISGQSIENVVNGVINGTV